MVLFLILNGTIFNYRSAQIAAMDCGILVLEM